MNGPGGSRSRPQVVLRAAARGGYEVVASAADAIAAVRDKNDVYLITHVRDDADEDAARTALLSVAVDPRVRAVDPA